MNFFIKFFEVGDISVFSFKGVIVSFKILDVMFNFIWLLSILVYDYFFSSSY